MSATGPTHVELVRSFANTLDVEEGTDDLATPDRAAAWFVQHGLLTSTATVADEHVASLRQVRDALRAVLAAHHGDGPPPPDAVEALRAGAAAAPLVVSLQHDGSTQLEPAGDAAAGALGPIFAAIHRAVLDGTWARLKICPRDDCRWAFYDASRNRSGKWCSMAVCGNRTKSQRFRERHG